MSVDVPREDSPMKQLFVLAPLTLASCSVIPSISVTPRYGPLDIDGDIAVSSTNANASSDADTLGLEDENVFTPRVDASWGPADIMVTGFSTEYAGRGMAEAQLDLGGVIINAGEMVDSSLDLTVGGAIVTFDLIPTGLVDIGIGLGATKIDFDARITSVSSSNSVSSAEDFIVPVLAARVGTDLGPIRLNVHASGLTGEYDDVDATFFDLDVYGEYSFEDLLGAYAAIAVGYRTIILDVEYTDSSSDIDADLEFAGIYFGLTVGI